MKTNYVLLAIIFLAIIGPNKMIPFSQSRYITTKCRTVWLSKVINGFLLYQQRSSSRDARSEESVIQYTYIKKESNILTEVRFICRDFVTKILYVLLSWSINKFDLDLILKCSVDVVGSTLCFWDQK